MDGWIKIHRKMEEWDWYLDHITKAVFIHLLLRANHKDKNWRGITIKRGSVLTGRIKLAEELKISERNVRTAFKHLKMTNEVTIKATNSYSIVTLNNYDKYQQYDQPSDQQGTNRRPASDQQVTTTKNVRIKELKKEKNIYIPFSENDKFIELWDKYVEVRESKFYNTTHYQVEEIFRKLDRMGEKAAVVALSNAIVGEWKTVHMPKEEDVIEASKEKEEKRDLKEYKDCKECDTMYTGTHKCRKK